MPAKSKNKTTSTKKKSPFGARIRKIREEAGLTREQFAELTGIPVNTLAGYEVRGKDPTGSNLEKIALSFPNKVKDLLLKS